ncbi:MAG TPA: PEGA domain-containing protein [Kofleriaceae bacterium]|nr:PEGA domain-containing protein [Kofleriaceae bacterium]
MEQFVATFHRFCGDDETFFVATMTSRPIGLETPFSIQLADRQPVLRGLCIVLDAWETPENRYKRPGIRLGIKRLTADSQVIYDRLKAASRTPGSGEGAPGPTPQPQLAAGSQPPGTMRRPATPPPLPPLLPPRTTPPAVPAVPREAAPPLVVRVPPLGAATPTTAPRLPRDSNGGMATRPASPSAAPVTKPGPLVTAKPALPSVVPVASKPTLPGIAPADGKPPSPSATAASAAPALAPGTTKPTWPGVAPAEGKPASSAAPLEARRVSRSAARASAPPASSAAPVEARPASSAARASAPPGPPVTASSQAADATGVEPAPAARAPIAVTRFQFALRVDTTPPPLTDVEFKPTALVPRKRLDRIIGEPSPSEAQNDDALPAVIIDRPSGPVTEETAAVMPSFATFESTSPTIDALVDRRTPGSSLVLPANPLQDLSDESIEGFVDCTIYEETENIFHPGVDGAEWADVTDPEQPLPRLQPAPRALLPRLSPPPIAVPTVPAMPFDTPPNLTVHVEDGGESLAVAPDDPALSRAVAGELGDASLGATDDPEPPFPLDVTLRGKRRASVAAVDPEPVRSSSGPLGVPSAEIIDDPPPSPPAVIVDDPALSRAMADEINRRAASDDPSQSRTASGELWSETQRRTPAAGLPRTQPRPDTPLPRPATNVPMDIGDSPDPASWFDSVSLPHSGAAPRPAMTMAAALAPSADPAVAPPAEPALASVLADAAFAPMPAAAGFAPPGPGFAPPGPGFAPGMPSGPGFAPGMPLGPGFAPGMPSGPGFAPGVPSGYGFGPGMPPGPASDPAYIPGPHDLAMPPGMQPAMPMFGAPEPGPGGPPGYLVDSAPYPRYSAADLVALPGLPAAGVPPAWQRWLLIAGSAVVAIIVAFVVARLARGSDRAAPAGAGAPASAPTRAVAPRTAPPPTPGAAAARAASPGGAAPGAGSAVAGDPDTAAVDGEPPAGEATEEDGEAAAGGTPVVGSGPCRFTVATTPAGAVVRFDDQPIGPSPITIEGSCDKHKVDVAHVRYQSVSRWVTLSADKPQELDISLPRPIHAVTVTSFPPGAELSIDGHRAGTTPTVIQVAGFATVNLTFTKPGFQTVIRKVYSKVAQDRVFVKLAK